MKVVEAGGGGYIRFVWCEDGSCKDDRLWRYAVYRTAPMLCNISTGRVFLALHDIPCVRHQRRQHLLGNEPPALSADGMRQDGRRRHSPRPFCFGGDVGVDGPRIAHVIDPTAEEGLDWCSEVEGDHAGCYRSHASRLHSRRWSLIWVLRALGGAIAAGIVAGNDSRAGTGAGRHCISWEGARGCRCIGG